MTVEMGILFILDEIEESYSQGLASRALKLEGVLEHLIRLENLDG